MGFEGWETKFGMVVLHGDMKEVTTTLFLSFSVFRASVKVKVAEKNESRKIRPKNEKKKKQRSVFSLCHEE